MNITTGNLHNKPPELVSVISLLQAALTEYLSPTFEFKKYRKLLLDSGAEVLKIKDGDKEGMSMGL